MSYAILAGTFGALAAGTLAEKIGRRMTIVLSDLFLILGPVILSIAMGPISLCFGRLLTGCGLGISMMVVPIFLSESAPIALRNQLGQSYFLLSFVGLIFSYYAGVLFAGSLFKMFIFAVVPAILQLILMIFTQSEPAVFLARIGNMINADKQLRSFYTFNGEESTNVRKF